MKAARLCVVATAVVLCAGTALAATGVNLVLNPGFDAAAGGNGGTVVAAPSWSSTADPTVVRWDAGGGFPVVGDPGPSDRGANFASGGFSATASEFVQVVDLSVDAALIDAGVMSFTVSGYLGGFASQDDYATLSVVFLSGNDSPLGLVSLEGPFAAERQNLTGLLLRSATGTVPAQSRGARVTITFTRTAGSFNDGYADSISLVLTPPATCAGDFNGDGVVNTADLVRFLGKFGLSVPLGTAEDMNGDGVVNTVDLTRFLGRFGTAC